MSKYHAKRTAGPKQKTPESGVLRQITDGLTADGIWWTRLQVINRPDVNGGWIRSGMPGMADILATPKRWMNISLRIIPVLLWIEVKSDKGVQRPEQRLFQMEVEARGHWYILARSYEDVRRYMAITITEV